MCIYNSKPLNVPEVVSYKVMTRKGDHLITLFKSFCMELNRKYALNPNVDFDKAEGIDDRVFHSFKSKKVAISNAKYWSLSCMETNVVCKVINTGTIGIGHCPSRTLSSSYVALPKALSIVSTECVLTEIVWEPKE